MSNDGRMGRKMWAIPEGYIPRFGEDSPPEATSHESVCLLNSGDSNASVRITVYFPDREPAGPYAIEVPARRTAHVQFKDLREPERLPRGADYVSVIESDVPIVVQQSRRASRQAEEVMATTTTYFQ